MSKEKIIKEYFQSWGNNDISIIDKIFSENAIYTECYGPKYTSKKQILKWFKEWQEKGKVIAWSIKNIYEINLTAGTYETQFSLRFNQTTLSNEDVVVNGLNTMFIQNNNTIAIKNELLNLFIEKVHLYNLLGQIIKTWDVSNYDQTNISIPVEFISTGTYIVKIQTTNGNFSKKIIKN